MNTPDTTDGSQANWTRLLVVIAFVLIVAGSFAYLMRDTPRAPAAQKNETIVAFDPFDHSPGTGGTLGRIDSKHEWTSVAGSWTINGGAARSLPSTAASNFSTVEIGENASISATTTGRGICGLVAVFSDLSNFVGMERDDQQGNWKLVMIRNGEPHTIGTVAGLSGANNRISLIVDPPVVTGASGGDHASFVVEDLPTGTRAGLFTRGVSSAACTFDDVAFVIPSQPSH